VEGRNLGVDGLSGEIDGDTASANCLDMLLRCLRILGEPDPREIRAKLGMTQEGVLRKRFERFGQAEDAVVYGLLREEAPDLVCGVC